MSAPFVGEIRMFGFNFAPVGWVQCDGQLFPISQNTALFSLLGTFYGGDGKSTFALPDLQGAAPLHQGQGQGLSEHFLGETGGTQSVALLNSEIPLHTHTINSSSTSGDTNDPTGHIWARAHTGKTPIKMYSSNTASPLGMSPQAFGITGSSLPHNNMPPYLVVNFCIALQGVFPPRQ